MLKKLIHRITDTKKSILVKSFITNFALAMVIVIGLVLLIFFWFQQRSIEDINSVTRLMLNNMAYKTTELLKGTGELAYQLFENNNIIELMMSEERNITNEVRISTNIDNLMISNPYLQSVYICNSNRVLMRKDRNSYYDAETDEQIFDIIYANSILAPIQRRVPVNQNLSINLISVIFHTAYPNNESINGAVIINMNADKLYQFISSRATPEDSSTFVINEKGDVVAHKDKNMFKQNLNGEGYIQMILNDPSNTGYHYADLNDEKYVINFVRSEDYKLVFIALNPYRTIISELNQAKDFMLIVCGIVLLLLLVSYFMLTLKIFKPVNQIISNIQANSKRLGFAGENTKDEFRYISQTLSGVLDYISVLDKREKDNIYILRNNFVWSLMNGNRELLSPVELAREFTAHQIDFDLNHPFSVVILRIDNFKSYRLNNSAKSKNLLLFSMGNIACELLGDEYPSYAFETDSDHEILLVNVMPQRIHEFQNEMVEKLKSILENINIFLKTSVTAAVSEVSEESGRLRMLYQQAMLDTNYRLVYGVGQVFSKSVIPEPGNPFCDKEIKDVVLAVKEAECKEFINRFDTLLGIARAYPYERMIKLFTDLYDEIMKIRDKLDIRNGFHHDTDVIAVYNEITAMENPQELKDYFMDAFHTVSSQISSANQLAAKDLIEDAINYIEANFQDSQISGNSVAKQFSLSPQYFSRMFSEYTGCSFPEYLNHVRLEKAKEMLLISDRNAFEIGELVGYANRSYFSTLFKKEYGLSPSKYRLLKTKTDC